MTYALIGGFPINEQDSEKSPQPGSLPTLIAWLSLCLLAAAWGGQLDERLQHLWGKVGACGITAAVGLGSLEKTRLFRRKWVRARAVRLQFDDRLSELSDQSAALKSIQGAILRLAEHAASERQKQVLQPPGAGDPLVLSQYPLQVIPVEENGDALEIRSAGSIAGFLHKISSSTVTFEHDRAFTHRVVLLTFKLGERKQLAFVVDVNGTQKSSDRFHSIGAVMAVGVLAHQESESAAAKFVQNA